MRNKGKVDPLQLFKLFFILFKCEGIVRLFDIIVYIMTYIYNSDKRLRELMFNHIINDIKNINKGIYFFIILLYLNYLYLNLIINNQGSRNEKLNKQFQTLMFSLLNDDHDGFLLNYLLFWFYFIDLI